MATSVEREQLRVAGVTKRGVDAALKKTTRPPKALEVSYAGFLTSGQRRVNAVIVEQLAAMGSILDIARRSDGDRFDDLNDDILAAFAALRDTIQRLAIGGVLRIGIVEHGSKTAQFNDEKYNSPVMNLLGIGNASASVEQRILNGWARENVQLITNMNAEQLGKLETLFLRALRDGSRSAQVQADVAHILGGSVNRARLIARDQIGKLNGQLDRQKQTEAGVQGYRWRGALDSRERPEHVAREGDLFQWDAPPVDGHPGQPVQCRCSPEPDIGPLVGDEFSPAPDKPTAAERARLEVERKRNVKRQAQKRRRRAKRAARATAG